MATTLNLASNNLCKQFCDAMGLDNVEALDLRMAVGEITTATVSFYPNKEQIGTALPVIKKFKLVPLKDKEPKHGKSK